MLNNSKEQLLSFVRINHLQNDAGIICFDANVISYESQAFQLVSEIQVISLPASLALYILHPFVTRHAARDVYDTKTFDFRHTRNNHLEIYGEQKKLLFLSLLQPAGINNHQQAH